MKLNFDNSTPDLVLRVEGDFQYSNFALIQSTSYQHPYEISGFPNYFAEPSNPGIDEMMYGAALCYHLGKREE